MSWISIGFGSTPMTFPVLPTIFYANVVKKPRLAAISRKTSPRFKSRRMSLVTCRSWLLFAGSPEPKSRGRTYSAWVSSFDPNLLFWPESNDADGCRIQAYSAGLFRTFRRTPRSARNEIISQLEISAMASAKGSDDISLCLNMAKRPSRHRTMRTVEEDPKRQTRWTVRGSGEDYPDRQYAQCGGQCSGSQTGLGDLNHGKLPSFATHK